MVNVAFIRMEMHMFVRILKEKRLDMTAGD
jgi:hypothetical protein